MPPQYLQPFDTSDSDTDEDDHKRVLVVGGTGLQGSAVAKRCKERKFNVYVMTRDPGSAHAQTLAAAGYGIVKGDLDDPYSLNRAVSQASGAAPGKSARKTTDQKGNEVCKLYGSALTHL